MAPISHGLARLALAGSLAPPELTPSEPDQTDAYCRYSKRKWLAR